MNKLEANVSLLIITFFAAIQYIFLSAIPDTVSHFAFLFSLLFWAGESVVLHKSMSLPTDAGFWGSVIYISFFIRGLYGIVQIYALRYVSPLNTSLIFSLEIIMTMFMSPTLTLIFGADPEKITLLKTAGGVVMVIGILAADSSVVESIKRRFVRVQK